MILREIRRTCQRNPLLTAVAIFILGTGFAGSTLAYTILRAMTATTPRGLQSLNLATIAEEATGGGSGELSWSSFEHLRDSHALPGVVLAAYSEPILVRLQPANLSDPAMAQEISLAAVSSEFFPSFTQVRSLLATSPHRGIVEPPLRKLF